MKILRKINVNNQRVFVLAKKENTFYKWIEDKKGIKDTDQFWSWEMSEELYKQVMEDYTNGIIQKNFVDCPIVDNPLKNLSDEHVLNITNWFCYTYMTWDNKNKAWNYGKNQNYEYETSL